MENSFIRITGNDLEREATDLDLKIECFIKSFGILPTYGPLMKDINRICDKYILKQLSHLKTINEKEDAISNLKENGNYNYYNTAANYADGIKESKSFRDYFTELVGPRNVAYDKSMSKFFSVMVIRKRLLDWYKNNILPADPALFNSKYTMDKSAVAQDLIDEKTWETRIVEPGEEIEVDVDPEAVHSYYWKYIMRLKPTWGRDVHDKGIAVTDVAGKHVMVMDAEQIPYTGVLGADTNLYLVKIGYSLVPLDFSLHSYNGPAPTEQEKLTKLKSTVHMEEKYLMTTKLTDGTQVTATGKDDEWAERTLKSRLKRTMLKTMKIL